MLKKIKEKWEAKNDAEKTATMRSGCCLMAAIMLESFLYRVFLKHWR